MGRTTPPKNPPTPGLARRGAARRNLARSLVPRAYRGAAGLPCNWRTWLGLVAVWLGRDCAVCRPSMRFPCTYQDGSARPRVKACPSLSVVGEPCSQAPLTSAHDRATRMPCRVPIANARKSSRNRAKSAIWSRRRLASARRSTKAQACCAWRKARRSVQPGSAYRSTSPTLTCRQRS
jgi:hypothetical protein